MNIDVGRSDLVVPILVGLIVIGLIIAIVVIVLKLRLRVVRGSIFLNQHRTRTRT